MSTYPGRVSTPQALLGGALVVAVLGGIVGVLGWLVQADGQIPALDAPAEPTVDSCPARSPGAGRPATVTAAALLECPAAYDGAAVAFTGEVVRAVLRRGDRAWVQLNDDPYALTLGPLPAHRSAVGGNSGIPVSIPAAVADQVTHVGDYRHRGDLLRVTGTFRRADPADGGGPAIQADTAAIERPGGTVQRPAGSRRVAVATGMAAAALGLALVGHVSRRRR